MIGKITRRLSVIFVILLLFCTSGVYATFHYSRGPVIEKTSNIDINFFPWKGEEILPKDEVGYNHRQLIENILNGTMISGGETIKIGMNNPNSALSKELDDRITSNGFWDPARYTFGSMDARDNSEMSNIFGLAASQLSFMIYMPKEDKNVRYLYTTGVYLGESGSILSSAKPTFSIGERIYPIYRTKLVYKEVGVDEKNKPVYEWVGEKTVLGSAESAYYKNDTFGSLIIQNPAFEPTTFRPISSADCENGETALVLGGNSSTAIWTYVGESLNGQVEDSSVMVYFRIKATSNSTITITPDEKFKGIQIKVYSDSALKKLVSNTNASGVTTFNATNNTVYYYTVTGSQTLAFVIS